MTVLVLSVAAFSQPVYHGPISLSVPGGTINLFWTYTSTGSIQLGPGTRYVTYGGVQQQVQDVNGACTEDNTNAGSLNINWVINVNIPGPQNTQPNGQVSFQFDEQQQSAAYAYCQETNDGIYVDATQKLTNASAYELGFNYYEGDPDDPPAVPANVANTVDFPTPWTWLGGIWTCGYYQVLSTSDSVNRIYIGTPSSMLFGGSNTDTIMNFNQSGPNGLGGNSLTID